MTKTHSKGKKKNYLKDVLKCIGGAGYVITAFSANISEGVFNTGLAISSGSLLDAVFARDRLYMNNILLFSMLFAAGLFTSIFIKDYIIGLYLEKGLINLKKKTIKLLNYAKLSWLDSMHTGELSSRITNDLNSLTGALRPVLILGISSTFAQLVSLVYLIYTNPKLTLIIFAYVPVISLLQWFMSKRIKRYRLKNLEAVASMTSVASDCFGAHETVKSLALEKDMLERFDSSQGKHVSAAVNEIRIDTWLRPFSLLCEWLPRITLMAVGGRYVLQGVMSVGELLVFMALSHRVIRALSGLPDMYTAVRRLSASCVRIARIWEAPKEGESGDVDEPIRNEPLIALNHVRFAYDPGKSRVSELKDISFNVRNGEFIALAGESGCGKSTILKLIASLYDPTGGTINFEGSNIRLWNTESMRKKIAYVTQETFLFTGTIRENIICEKTGISDGNIMSAVEAAGLAEFMDTLPQGLDTQIGERGIFLSGGQRQRISIARALITRPVLLLLDEATSALDKGTERKVVSSLLSLPYKPAIILAAHRLTVLRDAVCIYVIDSGNIAEMGTHEQLKRKDGIYAKMLSNIMDKEVGHVS